MGEIGVNWQVLLAQIVNFGILAITIGLAIWFIVWVIKKLKRLENISRGLLAITKARYAKGEISLEEFEQIKKELSG